MAFHKYKVYIDPASNITYSSYYITGLYELFGKKNVRFSADYFAKLNKREDDYSYDAYMAFVIVNNNTKSKVIIDFGDDYPVRENAYQWCDIYAKINYDPARTPIQFKDKIQSIPPGFGIKIWNVFEASYFGFFNLIQLKFNPQISLINHFRSYLSQFKQLPLKAFAIDQSRGSNDANEVFFVSSLWPHANCITGTNVYRKLFIESCLRNNVNFEGGFWVSDTNHPQFQEFKHLTFTNRYKLPEYIEKTRKSMLVFNTPAVNNCHGWKLGQFLAMNKAIISTPFQNKMPEDLVHGENIHFVENEQDLDAAVDKIINDNDYRKKMELGAKEYYLKYVTPISVITQICRKLNIE